LGSNVAKIREYDGDGIVVRYDALRCIHAAECVKGLRSVFNPKNRPWVDASAAAADEVADVVARCPTGALKFERTDGGAQETPPKEQSVRLVPDGPLYVHGRIQVEDADGRVIATENRVALCRCGASENKPFCDNSHKRVGFEG